MTAKKDKEEELVPVFIPPLVHLLHNAEKEKGLFNNPKLGKNG